jgi:hypothetical protein
MDVARTVAMCPRKRIDMPQGLSMWPRDYRCGPGEKQVGAAVNVVMNLLVPLLASQGPRCL